MGCGETVPETGAHPPMNPDSPSRTFIGSVVCIDLVGYSKQPVDRQIAIKAAFNRLLGQALEGIPPEDRIILDTGDGAAVSFLGDPEQGLAVGQQLRKSMNASAAKLGAAGGASPVRIGIHLGPVRVAMDLNGHPKIIGDGITVAERIMDFAQPGEIAVSRPYHDMVSRLSEEHARLFRHEGARTDRNGREHDLYFLEGADLKRRPAKATAAAGGTAAEGALVAFLRDRAKVGFAAALLVAVIVAEVAYLASRSPTAPPVSTVAGTPAAPAIDPPAASTAPAPAPVPSGLPPAAPPTSPPPEPKPASPVPKAETPTPSRADAKPAAPAKAEPAAVKTIQNLLHILPQRISPGFNHHASPHRRMLS